jgi:carbonic anhydrase
VRKAWAIVLLLIAWLPVSEKRSAQGAESGTRVWNAQWRTPWSYDGPRGPEHWSSLAPEYAACGGKEQSPIDIRSPVKADLPAARFEYRSNPLQYLINNGRTVRVNFHAPGSSDFLVVGNKRYELTQFHFHHPSDELIHGKSYDMVLHLMHEATDGSQAGVAVLLTRGKANVMLQKIWDHMPVAEGPEQNVPGVEINPAGLLPPRRALGYFSYTGSLTAPPCTEHVEWVVLRTPVEVSNAQISVFAKLFPHNVRPVQPLNGRVVRESRW